MDKNQTLDISWETILKVFVAIFIFYVIYLARNIALWFLFALAISILLEPAINALRIIHIPKIIAILIVYLAIFGILGLLIYISAPLFISELKQFSQYLPNYFNQISPVLNQFGISTAQNFNDFIKSYIGGSQESSEGIIRALMAFFGGVSSTAFILTMAFFLSLEEKAVEKVLLLLCPPRYEDYIKTIFERVQVRVAGWFGARLLACLFVGIGSYIIFYIFGIKYAFILALLSGFLNFVPYVGQWIIDILLIIFVAISAGSWLPVLYVLIAVFIIQEIDNKLLTPLLMKKLVDVPPVLVLISLLVGAQVFGFLGTIFAVPVFGIIYEFLKEFLEKRREESSDF